ncbi:hypothetical protein IGX29_17115 [Streptomyces sp. H28]|uniref:hypothetical protein n=1 Tax=Streptomyces sp. H28 TaxID=2775865 RepID=UPI00177B1858|nr:hypothetical protein [Streptomyces sp. H28]MBD9733487.1 hypothetical protein [Streptomyces sp. H28]
MAVGVPLALGFAAPTGQFLLRLGQHPLGPGALLLGLTHRPLSLHHPQFGVPELLGELGLRLGTPLGPGPPDLLLEFLAAGGPLPHRAGQQLDYDVGTLTRVMGGLSLGLDELDVRHVLVGPGLVHLPVAGGPAPCLGASAGRGALAVVRFSHRSVMCWSRPAW